jgi:hypothetical protein
MAQGLDYASVWIWPLQVMTEDEDFHLDQVPLLRSGLVEDLRPASVARAPASVNYHALHASHDVLTAGASTSRATVRRVGSGVRG